MTVRMKYLCSSFPRLQNVNIDFFAAVSNVFKIFNMIYSRQKDTNSALQCLQFTAQSDWVGPEAKFKEG